MSELDTENLSTVDLVQRMDSMLDYQASLKALREAAEQIGCSFVEGSNGDTMLPQIKECLAVALAASHVEARYPKEGEFGWASRLRVLKESGWAEARLTRMLAALDASGFVFRVGEEASLKKLLGFMDEVAALLSPHPSFDMSLPDPVLFPDIAPAVALHIPAPPPILYPTKSTETA